LRQRQVRTASAAVEGGAQPINVDFGQNGFIAGIGQPANQSLISGG